MPAKRLSTAFDSVTLYGNDPDLRPDIYGKVGNSGVSIATLDDMKVLYSGFDLCEPDDLGVDDDQRPGADDPGDVHEHRDRPAAREVQRRQRPRADRRRGREDPRLDAGQRARHGAGRHPEGRPGPEHLHLLDRVLAQGDGRHPASTSSHHDVRNFYSVSISGYHIAEAGANPISQLAFTLVERLHLRRGVPRARHAHRRLRAEPVVLLLATAWTRSTRCSAASRGASGRWRCATRTAPTSAARSSSTTPDLGPLPARAGDRVQRHPHHAAGADRDLRQLQLAAHQRLRRGDHHADRGERCAARWRSS